MTSDRLKSGKFRVRVYDRRLNKQVSFIDDKESDAKKKAKEYLAKVDMCPVTDTFGYLYKEYIRTHTAILSANTVREYEGTYKRYLKRFEYTAVYKMDNIMMQEFINELSEKLSPKTVENVYHVYTSVLTFHEVPRPKNVVLPMKVSSEMEVPSDDDVRAYIGALESTPYYTAVLIASYCGLRRGEIMALTMSKIDFKNSIITVDSALAKTNLGWIRKFPKSKAGVRKVPMPDVVAEAIKKYGLPKCAPESLTNKLQRYENKEGLKHIRFHSLRHYCASKMLSVGVPIKDCQKILGWENEKMLMRIYGHAMDSSLKSTKNLWNSAVLNLQKKSD